jgi:ribosomal-protein-alanine N-acetyltransferase
MGSPDLPAKGSSIIVIRAMISSDVPAVVSILQESPEASLWSEKSIFGSAILGTSWIAEQDGCVAGFLIGRDVADEFEILNMAVARAHRRRGIAGQLVREALQSAGKQGAKRAYLEVRASNEAAISLYQRHGFTQSGRRERYYESPPEDALLFTVEMISTHQ